MSISIDSLLGVHADALSLRTSRAGILGNNIAHADTPGYQARDIDFAAELAKRTGSSGMSINSADTPAPSRLHRTHESHLSTQSGGSSGLQIKYRTPLMPSVDRNTVNVQAEQAAFARNNIEMQAALRFLNGKIKGALTAIKGE